jgi:hypothetical protein
MDETNLLILIKSWLDTNYQITTKSATVAFRKIFQELNKPHISSNSLRSIGVGVDHPRKNLQLLQEVIVNAPFPWFSISHFVFVETTISHDCSVLILYYLELGIFEQNRLILSFMVYVINWL